VTFYDELTGERVELSLATYANWVAKASSMLADLGLERGGRIRIDLPTHWLGAVIVGAAWNLGAAVVGEDPEVVVAGPDTVESWARQPGLVVLACSLRPLGVRFADPLPAGVTDVGVEVWGHPDGFQPWEPAEPGDTAYAFAEESRTQGEIFGPPGRGQQTAPAAARGSRLLTRANPASPPGIALFAEALESSGSVVLVAPADPALVSPARLAELASAERATITG
jgi:uncharacterized protein (TIGR03089 family)